MEKYKLNIIIFLLFGIISQIIIGIPSEIETSSSGESEDKLYQQYLHDIKRQADYSINPCEDFARFACGKLLNRERIGYRFNDKDSFFIKDNLMNEPIKSDAERKAQDFYISCQKDRDVKQLFEQVDTLKSIAKWPTHKNFTKQQVAELMAELASIGEMEFIKIQIKENQIFLEGTQPLGLERFENITKTMEDFGTSPEESQASAKEIIEFLNGLETLYRYFSPESITDVRFQNRNILQRKMSNFDFNSYLMKYFNTLDLKIDNFNFDIRTKNLQLLESVINYIDKSDNRILVNYLIWKYIQFGRKHTCEEFLPLFRPVVTLRLWKKYLNNGDEERHMALLNNFEKSFNIILEKFKNPPIDDRILNRIEIRKNIVKNHSLIINDEIIQKHYESFEVDPNALFANQIRFYHVFARDYVMYGMHGRFSELYYEFLGGLPGEIDIMAHNKPMLYYFVSENVELWRKVFEVSKPWRNRKSNEGNNSSSICPKKSKFGEEQDFVEYAANKQSFNDYLKWLETANGSSEADEEYVEELGFLNQKRAYFMALAQYQCFDTGKIRLEDGGVFNYLKFSKEFNIEFDCKKNNPMNKVNTLECNVW